MKRWSHHEEVPEFSPRSSSALCAWCSEAKDQYESQWAAFEFIAAKIGCTSETFRRVVRQAECDQGLGDGPTTEERQRKGPGARGARAAQGQRNPKAGQRIFRPGEARPPLQVVIEFVERHRDRFGVESICRALQVAPSAVWREAARRRNPIIRPAWQQRDAALLPEIERVWTSNLRVYGADKVWKQLHREGRPVARCTVERLMSNAIDGRNSSGSAECGSPVRARSARRPSRAAAPRRRQAEERTRATRTCVATLSTPSWRGLSAKRARPT